MIVWTFHSRFIETESESVSTIWYIKIWDGGAPKMLWLSSPNRIQLCNASGSHANMANTASCGGGGQSQRPPQSKGTNVLWAARALESWVGLGPQVIFTLLANTDTLNSKPVGSDTHWPSTPFAFGKGCDISLCIRRQANISVPKRNPFISKKKSMRLWHVSISEGGSTPSLSCRGALKRRSSYVHRCKTRTLGATLANVEYVRHRLHEA